MTNLAWKEFEEAGLLWWANRGLHLFGWAIVLELDDGTGDVVSAYPARVSCRGFDTDSEERGFKKVTAYMKSNAVRTNACEQQ